jgi:hypothetical protein
MTRNTLTTLSTLVLAALSAPMAAHAEEIVSYGRAGGPVGADAIAYVSSRATVSTATKGSNYPGIAGGPVGAELIEHVVANAKPSSATHYASYPGIAGGPVGSDLITWLFHGQQSAPTALAASGSLKK